MTKTLATLLAVAAATAACAQTAAAPADSAPAAKAVTPKPAPIAAKPQSASPTQSTAKPTAASAPPPAPSLPFNRGIVVLDPAHGGVDAGSRISDAVLEKDVTLSFAFKLRSLLTARGFTVTMTRDSDADSASPSTAPAATPSLDDRAGFANHAHPLACLLLHATASGNGVHLYSSELDPLPNQPAANPWLTAQAPWVSPSLSLEKIIGQAIQRSNTPLVMSRASVRPMDSLTCPALVIELAPNGSDASSVNDADYQQRIAEAVAGAMLAWKAQAQPPAPAPAAPSLAAPLIPPPGGTP